MRPITTEDVYGLLDGHVTALEETTGDDVELRWYTGDKPEKK